MPATQPTRQRLHVRPFLSILAFAVLYYVATQANVMFAFNATEITSIRPASGVFVAALMLNPRVYWPMIIGLFWLIQLYVEQLYAGAFWVASITFATALALEALLVAHILQRSLGKKLKIDRAQHVFVLLVICSAGIVSGAAILPAYVNVAFYGGDFLVAWRQWSVGNATGMLVVLPLLLGVAAQGRIKLSELMNVKFFGKAVFQVLIVAATYYLFKDNTPTSYRVPENAFLIIPMLLYAAIQFGSLGSAITSALVFGTAIATDYFAISDIIGPNQTVQTSDYLEGFMLTVLSVVLIVSALIGEYRTLAQQQAARIRRANEQHEALVQIAKTSTLETKELNEAIQAVLEIAANALKVERLGLWHMTDNGEILHCEHLFIRSTGLHCPGAILQATDFPRYFEALRDKISIAAHDAENDTRTSEFRDGYLRPHQIRSMLDTFISVHHIYEGILCFEQVGNAREWHDDEVAFGAAAAEHVGRIISEQAVIRYERRQVEATRQQLKIEKMAALENLSKGIAHDYNNLITIIFGHTELVMQDSSDQATVEASMLRIQYATQRGIELTRRLTASSEDSHSIAAVTNVNDVLTNAVSLLGASVNQNIHIETDFFEPAPHTLINANEFEDALINICINGIHAMKDVGQLTISTSVAQLDAKSSIEREAGDYVVITIADTGRGMSASTMTQIFEPYFTTKGEGGTGLGLSQVHGLVGRAGGSIDVESQQMRGTTFTICLPCTDLVTDLVNEVQALNPRARTHPGF
jgi:signal transduction histidine kinase/integral membrane sensor domain MASE1